MFRLESPKPFQQKVINCKQDKGKKGLGFQEFSFLGKLWEGKYWIGQRIDSSFLVRSYRKTQTNFLANPLQERNTSEI